MMKYRLVNLGFLDYVRVVQYWQDIVDADLLKYRLPEVENPSMLDVGGMLKRNGNQSFYVVDEDDNILLESMLTNTQGLIAHIHFSLHPSCNGKKGVEVAMEGLAQYFDLDNTKYEGHKLRCLVGMTPVSNRLAVAFAKRVGFKKVDIIEDVFYNVEKNSFVGAFVSKLTMEDF